MKCMLSAKCTDTAAIRYPAVVSPKLDGIRAYVLNGQLLSRNGKLIRNKQLQIRFSNWTYEGRDGELIAGSATAPDCFNATTRVVSAADADASTVKFYEFDDFREPHRPYTDRCTPNFDFKLVRCEAELLAYEAQCLKYGFEGIMIRDPNAPYKFGRSTEREGGLMKLKRFEDAEALVLGLVEKMHNGNEATIDELGRTKRSSHQENKTPMGTLGAFAVRGINGRFKDVEFEIGMGKGLDDALRQEVWNNPASWIEHTIKYSYFPIGVKDKPRFPGFIGKREGE